MAENLWISDQDNSAAPKVKKVLSKFLPKKIFKKNRGYYFNHANVSLHGKFYQCLNFQVCIAFTVVYPHCSLGNTGSSHSNENSRTRSVGVHIPATCKNS